MLLTTAPLLLAAAAATAEPDFTWVDLPSWPPAPDVVWYVPEVFANDAGDMLVVRDNEILFGRLGGEMTEVSERVPMPSPDLLPDGWRFTEPVVTGLTRGGAMLGKWRAEPVVDDQPGGEPSCIIPTDKDVWFSWDPVRELLPTFYRAPDGGWILEVFTANATNEAVGMTRVGDDFLPVRWDATGAPTLLPAGTVVHGICDSGWTYGEAAVGAGAFEAVAWDPTGEPHMIGTLAGHSTSYAMCGLADSAFGVSQQAFDPTACGATPSTGLFMWTMDDGVQPFMPGFNVDLGTALQDLPPTTGGLFTSEMMPRDTAGPTGFLVDPKRGMIDLRDLVPGNLVKEGWTRWVGLTTLELSTPHPLDISTADDTVVGVAELALRGKTVRRAFTLRVGLSGADLAPPFGEVTFADLALFVDAFVAGTPAGDANGDGVFTFADVSMYLQAFLEEG
jgi:hypothetical protein